MKKTLLITLLALLGMSQMLAQEYEYVPFVREGVKWVYWYIDPYKGAEYEGDFIPYGIYYITFEIKGDTIINGKDYKPVHLYSGQQINETNDTVPVFLREEGKVVYGIIPDERRYRECPIGIGTMVIGSKLYSFVKTGVEFILYDFNDPISFYESLDHDFFHKLRYDHTDLIQVGFHEVKKHVFNRIDFDGNPIGNEFIIEGIGFTGDSPGMSLNYFYGVTSGDSQVVNHLSHVIENGEIIYKGSHFNPNAIVLPGDVDGDGEITIADANSVIDIVVMGGNAGHTRVPASDRNGDGEVTIADVNAIIDIIINGL